MSGLDVGTGGVEGRVPKVNSRRVTCTRAVLMGRNSLPSGCATGAEAGIQKSEDAKSRSPPGIDLRRSPEDAVAMGDK